MKRILCLGLVALLAGCAGPRLTYERLHAVTPGKTTRSQLIGMFGDPDYFESGAPGRHVETFEYYERFDVLTGRGTKRNSVTFTITNGVVQRYFKSN